MRFLIEGNQYPKRKIHWICSGFFDFADVVVKF
jgi:hypothetical protein